MSWIPPLELQTWLINVFSGDPQIFVGIGLLVISIMAGYFRMNGIGLFFILGIFLIMISGFISSPIVLLLAIIGGLAIGLVLSKIFVER